jgi:hypothetical protein
MSHGQLVRKRQHGLAVEFDEVMATSAEESDSMDWTAVEFDDSHRPSAESSIAEQIELISHRKH